MLIDGVERYGGEPGDALARSVSPACLPLLASVNGTSWLVLRSCPGLALPPATPQMASHFLSAVYATWAQTGRMFEKVGRLFQKA